LDLREQREAPLPFDFRSPYFDRLCVAVLAVEWIVFGSIHFSDKQATVAQLPPWLPARELLVVVTGILEVGTGILILVPRFRKWAAASSLFLLACLLPAMIWILYSDSALIGSEAYKTAFRLILIPNNVFLAICSIHLWYHPELSRLEPCRFFGTETSKGSQPLSQGKATLLVAVLLLASNCAGFLAILVSGIRDQPIATLWAMACIAVGAFIGFLFGVPRVNPDSKVNSYLLPNKNIEMVSDWLTKIIVGIGLVHLKDIGQFLEAMSARLGGAFTSDSSSLGVAFYKPFALGLIVYFFFVGLIQGYLLTRMFLFWLFSLEVQSAKAMDAPSTAVPAPHPEHSS
jgi:uncharacterized membrane protein